MPTTTIPTVEVELVHERVTDRGKHLMAVPEENEGSGISGGLYFSEKEYGVLGKKERTVKLSHIRTTKGGKHLIGIPRDEENGVSGGLYFTEMKYTALGSPEEIALPVPKQG